MLSLYELQENFSAGLKFENELVLDSICSSQLTATEQFAIYQSSVIGAKQKALKETYPVCYKLVGEDFFIAMINRYIPQTQSQSPDLENYGEDFSQFIAGFEPAKSVPYLSDVARLELACHRLYNAAEFTPFDIQKLAEFNQENGGKIIFQLAPRSALISSPYPIHCIWEVSQDNYQGDFNIAFPENVTFNLLIWNRPSGFRRLRIDVLNPDEVQILNWIQTGICLGNICDLMNKLFPESRIEEILPKIVTSGWIAGFSQEF